MPGSNRPPARLIALAALVTACGVCCLIALVNGWVRPETIRALVERSGSWAMGAYVLAVVASELLWMPRMWGLLAGGALFGPWLGGALSVGADLTAALICFALARGAGQDWVAGLLARRPRARRIVALLAERRGGVTVAVLRICPVAHYTLTSYAAGLAGVRPASFALGTLVGIVPGAVLYPMVGDAALRPTSPTFIVSVAILAVALVVTIIAGRRILRLPPGDDEER